MVEGFLIGVASAAAVFALVEVVRTARAHSQLIRRARRMSGLSRPA
jgi:hypothetical protein